MDFRIIHFIYDEYIVDKLEQFRIVKRYKEILKFYSVKFMLT